MTFRLILKWIGRPLCSLRMALVLVRAEVHAQVTPGARAPCHVFSLSHVALPFPPDDPLYGDTAPRTERPVRLGRSEARRETGVLNLPAWWLVRQRSNPFHAYLFERVKVALDVPPRAGDVAPGAVAP